MFTQGTSALPDIIVKGMANFMQSYMLSLEMAG